MLFNSWIFPVFLAVVLALYWRSGRKRQNLILLVASYVFYGWWDWRFLSLLVVSSAVDYFCGLAIFQDSAPSRPRESRRRAFLLLSLVTNLGILGFFKYFNFFSDSFADLLLMFGARPDALTLNVVLPVGISFYTFQSMSYTIDIYRNQTRPTDKILDFALYVSFFPQLVAGPIERSTHLLPQVMRDRTIDRDSLASAAQLILMGYFKKVLIADSVAPLVGEIFSDPGRHGGLELIMGTYLFAIQIYGDFSGYTDIARGVARLFGFDLRLNFRQPYLATSITEFWRRWHISLSSWLRDYLYIPLGGNRGSVPATYRNLMITMLLGGLWHGASWNFVIWGGLHGVYLAVDRLLRGASSRPSGGPPEPSRGSLAQFAKGVLTFNLVCFAWIFFRAETTSDALTFVVRMATAMGEVSSMAYLLRTGGVLVFFGALVLMLDVPCWRHDVETPFFAVERPVLRGLAYAAMIVLLVVIGEPDNQPFIYFQF